MFASSLCTVAWLQWWSACTLRDYAPVSSLDRMNESLSGQLSVIAISCQTNRTSPSRLISASRRRRRCHNNNRQLPQQQQLRVWTFKRFHLVCLNEYQIKNTKEEIFCIIFFRIQMQNENQSLQGLDIMKSFQDFLPALIIIVHSI